MNAISDTSLVQIQNVKRYVVRACNEDTGEQGHVKENFAYGYRIDKVTECGMDRINSTRLRVGE
jgi:hypothetical protein